MAAFLSSAEGADTPFRQKENAADWVSDVVVFSWQSLRLQHSKASYSASWAAHFKPDQASKQGSVVGGLKVAAVTTVTRQGAE